MANAANAFLATLKPEQKAKATFKLDDADRTRWHFVPTEMHPRHGLSFREMTQAQQHMAYALLASVMSARGVQKTAQIMSLEQVLHDANPNGRFARDPKWYFVSIFGKPSVEGTWSWRFEGHHLSLSFTVVDGHVGGLTPAFFGTNPGTMLHRLAKVELPEATFRLAKVHGFNPGRVTIRNQKTRWGSCSSTGAISLNWRLIQVPAFVRDYVILHELVHLDHLDHSTRFWERLAKTCPNLNAAEAWLKLHGNRIC